MFKSASVKTVSFPVTASCSMKVSSSPASTPGNCSLKVTSGKKQRNRLTRTSDRQKFFHDNSSFPNYKISHASHRIYPYLHYNLFIYICQYRAKNSFIFPLEFTFYSQIRTAVHTEVRLSCLFLFYVMILIFPSQPCQIQKGKDQKRLTAAFALSFLSLTIIE